MSHNNPPVRNAVIATIKEHGPMTCADTAGLMGWTVERVHGAIASARRRCPGQIFRVVGYQRAADGKGKDASIYAAQPGDDVPRPAVNKKARRNATQANYRKRHKAIVNARLRMSRAKNKGRGVSNNIWMQLADKSARSAMSMAAQRRSA